IPNHRGAGHAEQKLAVGTESETSDVLHIGISGNRQNLARFRVPQTNRPTGRGRRQRLTVGRECTHAYSSVRVQAADLLACMHVPQHRSPTTAANGHMFTIRRERCRNGYGKRMCPAIEFFTIAQVPDTYLTFPRYATSRHGGEKAA